MLNISPEYQLSRFRNRLENEDKYWKFNPGDLEERKHWGAYMDAFEQALGHCSPEAAPWYVVPAENRRFRDLMIAGVLVKTLREMNPQYPEPDFALEDYPPDSLR
jgi:polyphosphate kinase 2 (PPK2 family)